MRQFSFLRDCSVALLAAVGLCMSLLGGIAMAEERRPLDIAISEAFEAGELRGLHAALVILKNETLGEVYFDGKDEQWGRRLGVVHHGPHTLHDIRSITKSVTSLLYGIALAEGKVPAPEERLLGWFPRYADLAGDPLRDGITVGDALAMQMGTEWNEDLPYTDPRNSEIAMEDSADRYRFALDRKMVSAPGKQWSYNGGAAVLIGKLIEDGTGMPLDRYAHDKLFRPLGITNWYWSRGADNVPSAASGLRMTARDLRKIGQLVLNGGQFQGRRIVSHDWLDRMFKPRSDLFGVRYGYFWWLADASAPRAWVSGLRNTFADIGTWPAWVGGLGNGGQRLSVQPDIGLVVVVLAGNYNEPDNWVMPVRIIEEHVTLELRRRLNK